MSINVGVIGTGNIGQDHIRRITQALCGARVVAVTDIDLARAQRIAKDLGGRAESSSSMPSTAMTSSVNWLVKQV
jgi:myo-inositol 2-dehydrogenase / D-chiro-inositol 1-dehydrogenase